MIISVGKAANRGGNHLKSGYKRYKYPNKRHFYVYQINDEGKFCRIKVNPLSVPYWRLKVEKLKTLHCPKCKTKYRIKRSSEPICPYCHV